MRRRLGCILLLGLHTYHSEGRRWDLPKIAVPRRDGVCGGFSYCEMRNDNAQILPSENEEISRTIPQTNVLMRGGSEEEEKQGNAEAAGNKDAENTTTIVVDETETEADSEEGQIQEENSGDESVEEEEEVPMVVTVDDVRSVATDISSTVVLKEEEDSSEETSETENDFAEDEDNETTENEEILAEASEQRRLGKQAHDDGEFETAAQLFGKAADLLQPLISEDEDNANMDGSGGNRDNGDGTNPMEEYATCRLHQALCHLKSDQYTQAERACTKVLECGDPVAPALRARAFHRRAKAQLEMGQETDALQDARSAAFLGDRKAVALYGKLMRESSSSTLGASSGSPADFFGGGVGGDANAALLESLLGHSQPSASSQSGGAPFDLPSSLLGSVLQQGGNAGGGGGGGLAKSLLSSLSKKLDDPDTQEQICGFLSGASAPQIQQMAGMAGVPLRSEQADSIASFCHRITPKGLRRTVTTSRRVVYVVRLIRKTLKLLQKYRTVLVLLLLLGWIKSALLRPLPVDKRALRAAAKATKKAAASATQAL